MNKIKYHTGLITGATSGIGLALSMLLAQQGFKLYLLGRNFDELKNRFSKMSILNQPELIKVDISDPEMVENSIGLIRDRDQIDFLIHSAGLIHLNLIENATLEEFDVQFQVNVKAAFQISKLLLPDLKKSKGTIIFLNSTAGLQAWENLGLYAASKHALKALAESLRKEMQEFQVRISSIYLGSVNTPMQEKVQSYRNNDYDSSLFLDPQHVALLINQLLELPVEMNISELTVLGNKNRK